MLRLYGPFTKKHEIELSPDLILTLPNLSLPVLKTTGRETDEPELKLNSEQLHFTQVFPSSANGTCRVTMILKGHQPGLPGNKGWGLILI